MPDVSDSHDQAGLVFEAPVSAEAGASSSNASAMSATPHVLARCLRRRRKSNMPATLHWTPLCDLSNRSRRFLGTVLASSPGRRRRACSSGFSGRSRSFGTAVRSRWAESSGRSLSCSSCTRTRSSPATAFSMPSGEIGLLARLRTAWTSRSPGFARRSDRARSFSPAPAAISSGSSRRASTPSASSGSSRKGVGRTPRGSRRTL